jgi:hypothetical protein
MIIRKPKDLRWANEEKTAIDMIVETDRHGEIPFTACEEPDEYGIFKAAVEGKLGEIAPYVRRDPPPEVIEMIRQLEEKQDT